MRAGLCLCLAAPLFYTWVNTHVRWHQLIVRPMTKEPTGNVPPDPHQEIPLHVIPFIIVLKSYRYLISPVLQVMGVRCRHEPSCSVYALEAFRRDGVWRGGWLTLSRLLRCHPCGSYGFDPVPPRRKAPWWNIHRIGDWGWTERCGHSDLPDRTTDHQG